MRVIDPNDRLDEVVESLTPEQKVKMFGAMKPLDDTIQTLTDAIEARGGVSSPTTTEDGESYQSASEPGCNNGNGRR